MEWISVKDKLPEEGQDVLILVESIEIYGKHKERKELHRNIYCGYYDEPEWLTYYCYGCEYIYKMNEKYAGQEEIKVTHWMPLPGKPEVHEK